MIKGKQCIALVDKNILRTFLKLQKKESFVLEGWDVYDIPETAFYLFLLNNYDDQERVFNSTLSVFQNCNGWPKVSQPSVAILKEFVESTYKVKPVFSNVDFFKIFVTNDDVLKIKKINEMQAFEKDYNFIRYDQKTPRISNLGMNGHPLDEAVKNEVFLR